MVQNYFYFRIPTLANRITFRKNTENESNKNVLKMFMNKLLIIILMKYCIILIIRT